VRTLLGGQSHNLNVCRELIYELQDYIYIYIYIDYILKTSCMDRILIKECRPF
jgi:hypothetical protein